MKKTRHDLIPAIGIKRVSEVYTEKLDKYNINEWKKGLNWSDVISSLKQHLNNFECGEDYTNSGTLSIAEVAANALILAEYYTTAPHKDDRVVLPYEKPIIGMDLDGVIFDFNKAYMEKFGVNMNDYWNANYEIGTHLKELEKDKDFWVNLPVLNRPCFEVDHYITSRNIPKEWIMESLQKNGLPCAPVHTVDWNCSKVGLLKELGITLLIDDKYSNFTEASESGVFCYLMDAPHNKHYNVGHKRIYNLNVKLK